MNILKQILLFINAFIWICFGFISFAISGLWSLLFFFLAAFIPLRATRVWIKNNLRFTIPSNELYKLVFLFVFLGFVTMGANMENTPKQTSVSPNPTVTKSSVPTPTSPSPLLTQSTSPTESISITPTPTVAPTPEQESETQETHIKVDTPSSETTKSARFVVSDSSTTESAFGGDLRKYDIHIAKIFEVTHWWCMQAPGDKNGLSWKYFADGGEVDMGTFNISCNEANNIALRFRFSKPENTKINVGEGSLLTEAIPVLDIDNEGASSAWIDFTNSYIPNQNFVFSSDSIPSSVVTATPSVTPQTPVQVDPNTPTRSAGSGLCECPYDYNTQGQLCGDASAYSRPGGASPICYERDRL